MHETFNMNAQHKQILNNSHFHEKINKKNAKFIPLFLGFQGQFKFFTFFIPFWLIFTSHKIHWNRNQKFEKKV